MPATVTGIHQGNCCCRGRPREFGSSAEVGRLRRDPAISRNPVKPYFLHFHAGFGVSKVQEDAGGTQALKVPSGNHVHLPGGLSDALFLHQRGNSPAVSTTALPDLIFH